MTTDQLVALYTAQAERPLVIDLTGGQPDLTPEWIVWMMDSLEAAGLSRAVYLWSDDNLSNDYFWRHLSPAQIQRVASYPMYGRVCCFKGYNDRSFAFNTSAEAVLFDRQFDLMSRLMRLGIDIYAYATFTTPDTRNVHDDVERFVDRLQSIDPLLPLRLVPLKIAAFTPVTARLDDARRQSLDLQQEVVEEWRRVLEERFPAELRGCRICDVPLSRRN